ncbi:MAG: peptide deformylase [Clostridiales bacterium]|nr:peptide deformylase [Clostridiales bacterium]
MALRTIRMLGDEILTKKCREVKEMTPRMRQLIDDMLETMYDANGVGLAAPQVGVLRRIVVIDIGEGPLIMVNPVILETDGEQTGDEGCLSLTGKAGQVTRPNYVKARFFDEEMEEYEIEAEELLARAICHELDHLDGHMYVEKVEGEIHDVVYEEAEEDEESDGVEDDVAAESADDREE